MPIFISYSTKNSEFVEKLAQQLILRKHHIWLDKWEINVGDSLITKIQGAVQNASALIIILSSDYVNSEWCKKELNAGLMREIDKKKFLVIPVLFEKCELPILLLEKKYADFTSNYDNGLKDLLKGIEKFSNVHQGRIDDTILSDGITYNFDWSIDTFYKEDTFNVVITIAETAKESPYTVIGKICISLNTHATLNYNNYLSQGKEEYVIATLLLVISRIPDFVLILEDHKQKEYKNIVINDKHSDAMMNLEVNYQWLGENNGQDIFVNINNTICKIHSHIMDRLKSLPDQSSIFMFNS